MDKTSYCIASRDTGGGVALWLGGVDDGDREVLKRAVVNLLEGHFRDLVDYAFTARMEDDLDEIAGGRAEREPWLGRFWFGNGVPGVKTPVPVW